MFHCLANRVLSGQLSGKWRAFPGSLETLPSGTRPCNGISCFISNRHDRIVKSGVNMDDTARNILFFFFFGADFLSH